MQSCTEILRQGPIPVKFPPPTAYLPVVPQREAQGVLLEVEPLAHRACFPVMLGCDGDII